MRNGEIIWCCSRISEDNAEVDEFSEAKSFMLRPQTVFNPIGITCQSKNGFSDRLSYGETTSSNQRIMLYPYVFWKGKFKVGDRFYINGAEPKNEKYNGENANYYVEFVNYQNEAVELSLKQIKNN